MQWQSNRSSKKKNGVHTLIPLYVTASFILINVLTFDITPRIKWNAEYFVSANGEARRSEFIIGEIIYEVVGERMRTAGAARLQVGSGAADTHVEY